MSQKFSPTSQLELWKQAQIPLISLSFTFKCHASKPNHFLRNSKTWLGSEVGSRVGRRKTLSSSWRGFAFFQTLRQEGPESWGWECSVSCNGIQRSHCVWYFCFPIGLWQQHQKQQILQFYIWKEAFFYKEKKKTLLKTLKPNHSIFHSLKDWDLSDTMW